MRVTLNLSWPPTWRCGLIAAGGIALFALLFAWTAQYGFDYQPCKLCLWQRLPYALIVAAAVVGALWPRLATWRGALLVSCAALLLVETGLALFHVGVERHWWGGVAGCSFEKPASLDVASIRDALLSMPVVACDAVSWTFLGWSMAVWNAIYAFAAMLVLVYIVFFGKINDPQNGAPSD